MVLMPEWNPLLLYVLAWNGILKVLQTLHNKCYATHKYRDLRSISQWAVKVIWPTEYLWPFSFDVSWNINCTQLSFNFDTFKIIHSAAKIDIGVDVMCSSETLAGDATCQTAWCHTPKDNNIILRLVRAAKFL
jgi:hypothetical protein